MNEMQHGLHLIVDLQLCNSALLNSKKLLEEWLNNLPAKLGMKILSPASMRRITEPECVKGQEGLSGFVMIYESHISVHTFPTWGSVYVDVFSCKGFDHKAVLTELTEAFASKQCEKHLIKRMYQGGSCK